MGGLQSRSVPASSSPAFEELPLDALRAICRNLKLEERARLACCSRALYALEDHLLLLGDVAISLTSMRQALSWAEFLAHRAGCVQRLSMELPLHELCLSMDLPLEELCMEPCMWYDGEVWRRLWAALAGAQALEQLTWIALFKEDEIYPLCPSTLPPGLPLAFAYEPLALPSLRQLNVRASVIDLPAVLRQLPSLTALHLAGQCLILQPGCLPNGLLSLSARWLPRRDPVDGQPAHIRELAQAASQCSRLAQLSLAGALSTDGLGTFGALTSLDWTQGYISSLQEVGSLSALRQLHVSHTQISNGLTALMSLQQLSKLALASVSVGRDWEEAVQGVWQLPSLEALALSGVWCEGQEALVPILPEPGNKLTSLGLDARSLCAEGASRRLMELGSLEQLSVLHVVARAAEGAVGYSTSQSKLVELLRSAVEVLPRLRGLHVNAYGAGQPFGSEWLPEGVRAELSKIVANRPKLLVLT